MSSLNEVNKRKESAIIHTIGLNNNLRDEEVREMVESQFRFMYETIRGMDLDNMTPEEIDKLKTNFFFKYLGKVYTTGEIVDKHKFKLSKDKERHEEEERNSLRGIGDQ